MTVKPPTTEYISSGSWCASATMGNQYGSLVLFLRILLPPGIAELNKSRAKSPRTGPIAASVKPKTWLMPCSCVDSPWLRWPSCMSRVGSISPCFTRNGRLANLLPAKCSCHRATDLASGNALTYSPSPPRKPWEFAMFGLMRCSCLRSRFTVVLVVGLTFLGWFTFANRSSPDPQTNKMDINVSVDRSKMGNDLQHLEQRVNQGIQGLQNPPQNSDTPISPTAPRNGSVAGFLLGTGQHPAEQSDGRPAPDGQQAMPGHHLIGPIIGAARTPSKEAATVGISRRSLTKHGLSVPLCG